MDQLTQICTLYKHNTMADIEMINDAFWLNYAKDHVTAAVTERDDAAGKLDTYLGIIWPLYTAAFALSSTFNIIHSEFEIPILIILSLPILLIPIARFLCTWWRSASAI